jgi:dTDP-4-dehydrorhamnose reductase
MMVITGGSGRLGKALQSVMPEAVCPTHQQLDVTNRELVNQFIQRHAPQVIIHAAAMTDVGAAEVDQHRCWNTNVHGTEVLVDALGRYAPHCYLVYVGTACVFYGDRGNYSEEDIPHPKNFYGISKLVAEYVARRVPKHLVLRTNFVANEPWPYPRAFTDRFGTYLFADDVATAMRQLIEAEQTGLVHVVGSQRMSMYELARLTSPDVGMMTMADVSMPLTVDMSLRSVRIAPVTIGSSR